MTISRRHHYIPRFLIKNFADNNGFLHVYNKEDKRIISNQSPKAIFFEMNRNVLNIHGAETDNIEKIYAELDNKLALVLDRVLKTKILTPEDLTGILLLVTTTKWRVPSNDDEFNKIKEETTYEDLPIKITVKKDDGKDNEQAFNYIINSDIFKESKRFILPFLPFYKYENLEELHKYSFINTNDGIISLIGDCPLIESSNEDIHTIANFIFPLSNTDTFLYKKNTIGKISNRIFYTNKDLAVLHLSRKYVACKDKNHLENIVKIYQQIENDGNTEQIVPNLFKVI